MAIALELRDGPTGETPLFRRLRCSSVAGKAPRPPRVSPTKKWVLTAPQCIFEYSLISGACASFTKLIAATKSSDQWCEHYSGARTSSSWGGSRPRRSKNFICACRSKKTRGVAPSNDKSRPLSFSRPRCGIPNQAARRRPPPGKTPRVPFPRGQRR